MVDRREVEALLAIADSQPLDEPVPTDTLAALCRAWLAVDGGIVATLSRNDVDALALPDSWAGQRVRIVKEVEEIPKPGTQRMFSEAWSDPEFVAQVEAEKAETQAMIERHRDPETGDIRRVCICYARSSTECVCGDWEAREK